MPSSGFQGYQAHESYTFMQAKIYTHKIKIEVTYEKSFEERRKLRVIQPADTIQDGY